MPPITSSNTIAAPALTSRAYVLFARNPTYTHNYNPSFASRHPNMFVCLSVSLSSMLGDPLVSMAFLAYVCGVGQVYEERPEKKRRAPAWCDRVLWRTRDEDHVAAVMYSRAELMLSDHKPVCAELSVKVCCCLPVCY